MSRTKNHFNSETSNIKSSDTANSKAVPQAPTPIEPTPLTPDEVALADYFAKKAVAVMIRKYNRDYAKTNSPTVQGTLTLCPPYTSYRVELQAVTRIKEIMLESGWDVSINKRSKPGKHAWRSNYDYSISKQK